MDVLSLLFQEQTVLTVVGRSCPDRFSKAFHGCCRAFGMSVLESECASNPCVCSKLMSGQHFCSEINTLIIELILHCSVCLWKSLAAPMGVEFALGSEGEGMSRGQLGSC